MTMGMDPFTAGAVGLGGTLAGGGKTASDYGGGPGLVLYSGVTGPDVPYSSSPGLQPGNAANGIRGVSWADPSRVENRVDQGFNWAPNAQNAAWNYAAPQYQVPGAGQTYVQNALGIPQPTQGRNNTQAAFDWFGQNQPNLGPDAGLGTYYENAKRRALESVNANAAARGAYGSSAAMDMGNEAITNLEAERANREAEYALQRAAEQRGWGTAAAGAAGTADAAALGRAAEGRNWVTGLGALGLGSDAQDLSKLNSLMSGASGVDQARANANMYNLAALGTADTAGNLRATNALNATMGLGNAVSGTAGAAYQPMVDRDAALRDQFVAWANGMPTELLAQQAQDRQNARSDFNQFMDFMTWRQAMQGGGGDGGGIGL
jgi:hypothetical protein